MLSAIKAIGACLIILAAVYGLVAIVLMLLIRIKDLFKILRGQIAPQQGRPAKGLKASLRDIAIEARNRPGRFLFGVAVVSACMVFFQYVLLGLILHWVRFPSRWPQLPDGAAGGARGA